MDRIKSISEMRYHPKIKILTKMSRVNGSSVNSQQITLRIMMQKFYFYFGRVELSFQMKSATQKTHRAHLSDQRGRTMYYKIWSLFFILASFRFLHTPIYIAFFWSLLFFSLFFLVVVIAAAAFILFHSLCNRTKYK